jgi:hypothetical protein
MNDQERQLNKRASLRIISSLSPFQMRRLFSSHLPSLFSHEDFITQGALPPRTQRKFNLAPAVFIKNNKTNGAATLPRRNKNESTRDSSLHLLLRDIFKSYLFIRYTLTAKSCFRVFRLSSPRGAIRAGKRVIVGRIATITICA